MADNAQFRDQSFWSVAVASVECRPLEIGDLRHTVCRRAGGKTSRRSHDTCSVDQDGSAASLGRQKAAGACRLGYVLMSSA